MRKPLGCLSPIGVLAVLVVLAGLLALTLIRGPIVFSAGPLSAAVGAQALGGVRSHAELAGRCGACHVAPWSSQTMADRCLGCHQDVATEMRSRAGFHAGALAASAAPTCRGCHTDHQGPSGTLTVFDHRKSAFPLTGAHASLKCEQCHHNSVFQGTPKDCLGCHPEPTYHAGAFGNQSTQCATCHNTTAYAPAQFNLPHAFPINHGERGRSGCTTCHPDTLRVYTCYAGCHRHSQARTEAQHAREGITDLTDCAHCHQGGRGEGGGGGTRHRQSALARHGGGNQQ